MSNFEELFNDVTKELFNDFELRQWRNFIRVERIALLEEADVKINTLSDANQDTSVWRTYRQQLRDITNNITEVNVVTWPVKPE